MSPMETKTTSSEQTAEAGNSLSFARQAFSFHGTDDDR